MMMRKLSLLTCTVFLLTACFTHRKAVEQAAAEQNPQAKNPYYDWFNKDALHDSIQGLSTEAAYKFLKRRRARTVIVAVIDDGVDIKHEDLKGKIWTNKGEIPGNGKDDDHNGYIDDVHGWNFLGNAKGEMVDKDTYEIARIYKKYHKRFEAESEAQVPASEKAAFKLYQKVKKALDKKRQDATMHLYNLSMMAHVYRQSDSIAKHVLGKDTYTIAELKADTTKAPLFQRARNMLVRLKKNGFDPAQLKKYREHFSNVIHYYCNPDFNHYETVVGTQLPRGNAKVWGVNPFHGTHVAGIIAADRHNGIGIRGVADKVKIMPIITVPDGDERDENVAAAINYAVDNGAKIINMSFGKRYSPGKALVDAAVKHAMEKGVLMIHSAGNDGVNTDSIAFYPNRNYIGGGIAQNWISVGASSAQLDKQLPTYFSNYSHSRVDVFAPGNNILSTEPHDKYALHSGTSMAGPMVAGIAAVIWSYFPKLSAGQVRDIILQSAIPHHLMVNQPNDHRKEPKLVKFGSLSRTGGIANLYKAVQLAKEINRRR